MPNTLKAISYLKTDKAAAEATAFLTSPLFSAFNSPSYMILPGFCDVHVHFREPGFSYKETVKTGSMAAARGGYTAVCTMANLSPVPDSPAHLKEETDIIQRDAAIAVYPYASITVGENGKTLVPFSALKDGCIAFSDDGRGVQEEEMMRAAMTEAKKCGKLIVAHCEVNALLSGGYIHDGAYAKEHGHRGISSESEWKQIERDIKLSKETGCAYHVCHISTKESVRLIREAKRAGVDITCETAPHYLVLDDADLKEDGRFKMNPPLRGKEDREELLRGILDGTIDMIATDHAPHTAEEKSRGLEKSLFGVVGLETAFPVLYTHLVKTGLLSMERLLSLLVYNPRQRFGITSDIGFSVWETETPVTVNPDEFLSMGRATPFAGDRLYGQNILTVYRGKPVYQKYEKEYTDHITEDTTNA